MSERMDTQTLRDLCRVLNALSEKPQTPAEIADASLIPVIRVRSVLRDLTAAGVVDVGTDEHRGRPRQRYRRVPSEAWPW
jgi:predicted ArsR family transcriptional regulator